MAPVTVKEKWGILEAAPVPSSLLHHVTPSDDITWADTVDVAQSYNCLDVENEIPWPCPEPMLDAPEGVTATPAADGGTVAAGTYFVAVSTLTVQGESTPSAPVQVTTTGATSTITIDWEEVNGASGYRIYIGTAADALKLQGTDVAPTYVRAAPPTDAGAAPQTTNGAVWRGAKVLDGTTWLDGFTFVTQGGVMCKPFGFTLEEGREALERAYELRESKGVERALVKKMLFGAQDITPASGAVDACLGLAMLEGLAGSQYAGQPLIHVSRTIGSILTQIDHVKLDGDLAHTKLRAPVVIGAGYEYPSLGPDGQPAPAGEQWIYATGTIKLARGQIEFSEAVDVRQNDFAVIGERAYAGVVDCFTAAIRVKVE